MNLAFNPKDANTFASACLDHTVKMWSLGAGSANFTMDAHDKGVNYVDFYPGADKPYLVTTGDDKTVKVWDYLSKSCVQTMEGHTNNVSFAVFHPHLLIILSGRALHSPTCIHGVYIDYMEFTGSLHRL
jgi:coatomer subunit beta'